MRKSFLFLFLFLFIAGFAQPGNNKDSNKLISGDSVLIKLKQQQDSVIKANEAQKKWEEENNSGLNYIIELQKEHRAKEKRKALIQIAVGVALLIVLIIGLRRRIKKK